MEKKNLETFFYSTLGVVAVLLILIPHRRESLHAVTGHPGHSGQARYAGSGSILLHEKR